jgi:hypothetical protein
VSDTGAATSEARRLPQAVEDAIRGVSAAEKPGEAALTLAAIAHRAIAELNKLARAEANRQRGQPDWGTWAGLANSARDAVLKTATCRKAAAELAQKASADS